MRANPVEVWKPSEAVEYGKWSTEARPSGRVGQVKAINRLGRRIRPPRPFHVPPLRQCKTHSIGTAQLKAGLVEYDAQLCIIDDSTDPGQQLITYTRPKSQSTDVATRTRLRINLVIC